MFHVKHYERRQEKMDEFFSLQEVKQKTDLNGKSPRMVMICGNRIGGKTTALVEESICEYLERGKTTVWLFRDVGELDTAPSVYDDVVERKYPDVTISGKKFGDNLGVLICWNDGIIGIAIALKRRDKIKRFRALFKDLSLVVFDEFLPEDGKYLQNECGMFVSVYLTLISGGGKQYRDDVKFYLIANQVNAINPYFIRFGIVNRLRPDTKFLRGDDWILQLYVSTTAKDYICNDALIRQLSPDTTAYSAGDRFLIDHTKFIVKPKGKHKYLYTIKFNDKYYGVCDYYRYVLITDKGEKNEVTVCFDYKDQDEHTYMLKKSHANYKNLVELYNMGLIRFNSAESKDMFINLLGINFY